MSMIKNFLIEEEVSYEDSGMEEYELYLLYEKLKEKGVNTDFFLHLMEEN